MAQQIIGQIPEFTQDEGVGVQEVKETAVDQPAEEKDTPSELPTEEQPIVEEQPVEEAGEPTTDVDADARKQVQGLQEERARLLKEIQELRGQKREIKKEDLIQPGTFEEVLKDVHPDDVKVVDKILRAKGYVTKEEAQRMLYKTVQDEEMQKFLEEFPEYKPENDPNDLNWGALQRELGYYRLPEDPRKIAEVLKRAHQAVSRSYGGRSTDVKKQQLATAAKGSGGIQRSNSARPTLNPTQKEAYRRGGWSEEEIKELEDSL